MTNNQRFHWRKHTYTNSHCKLLIQVAFSRITPKLKTPQQPQIICVYWFIILYLEHISPVERKSISSYLQWLFRLNFSLKQVLSTNINLKNLIKDRTWSTAVVEKAQKLVERKLIRGHRGWYSCLIGAILSVTIQEVRVYWWIQSSCPLVT